MSIKYDFFGTRDSEEDDADYSIYGIVWGAMVFTASDNYTITGIQLYGRRKNSCGTVTVSIKAVDEENNDKPIGDDLCFGTKAQNDISTVNDWNEWDFGDGTALTNGTKYAIVERAPDGNSNNKWCQRVDLGRGYADGTAWTSNNGGSTWFVGNYDYLFETYGALPVSYVDLSGTGGGMGSGLAALEITSMADMVATGGGIGSGSAALVVSGFPSDGAGVSRAHKRVVAAGNDRIYYEDI